MRSGCFLAATLTLWACPAAAQGTNASPTPGESHSIERAFVSGGQIRMVLAPGDYTIRPSEGTKVVIRWQVLKPEKARRISVTADVKGSECLIETQGRHNDFKAEIDLPANANLYIRLKAGDLNLRGIEGNKDIDCRAGDVTIDVGPADNYGPVDASVRVGDFEAPPFGASKGGFLRKFKWQGPGKYTLHAHVGVGSLSFLGMPSASNQSQNLKP